MDPYQILGVPPTASDDEVKTAYRKLSRRYHPDANIGKPDAAAAEDRFKQVSWAYDEIMKMRSNPYSYTSQSRSTYSGYGAGSSYGGYSQGNSYGGYGTNGYGTYGRNSSSYSYNYNNAYANYFNNQQNTFNSQNIFRVDLSWINTEKFGGDGYYYKSAISNISAGRYSDAKAALAQVNGMPSEWYYLSAIISLGLGDVVNAQHMATLAYDKEPNNMEYWKLIKYFRATNDDYVNYYTSYRRARRSPCVDYAALGLCIGFNVCSGGRFFYCCL